MYDAALNTVGRNGGPGLRSYYVYIHTQHQNYVALVELKGCVCLRKVTQSDQVVNIRTLLFLPHLRSDDNCQSYT